MIRAVASAPTLNTVAESMLGTLSNYLPPADGGLPIPTVSVASMRERAVGIGGTRGAAAVGLSSAISLKGVRLDALARFQLWALDPVEADLAIGDLNMRLMADRDGLRGAGFLRMALEITPPAEAFLDTIGGWRRYADYRVLYEFDYQDTDGAQGLIARIPVSLDSGLGESMTITDEMGRWDNLNAPPLVVRGPASVGGMSLLAFVPGPPPTAAVTLTRTYDGAPGNPASYATLTRFLAAVSGDKPLVRHARVAFPSFAKFRAEFQSAGDAITLGDWNHDAIPDSYKPLARIIDPVVQLPKTADRFEITYQAPKFDKTAVVYLRVTP
jgi:hypothetical protein